MANSNPSSQDHDSARDAVLAEFLEAVEQDRTVTPDVWIDQYPEFADELNELHVGQQALKKLMPTPDSVAKELDNADTQTLRNGETETVVNESESIIGSEFGEYELLSEIARGEMGIVYKAKQTTLNRTVALKMILASRTASEKDIERFHTEAEAAAHLDHPGIVPIFQVGECDGQHFFSMAFVNGESLASKLNDGPCSSRQAAELLKTVADAVQYAHNQGVIHRDLKPANILLDENGQPRVTDFGLAKRVECDSKLTATGEVVGTPSYMSPEQATMSDIEATTDVYALGGILYCLLTGRPPFQGESVFATLMQVINQEPISPHQLNPSVSRELETICLKCLQKKPRHRYQSCQELSDELTRFLEGKPI